MDFNKIGSLLMLQFSNEIKFYLSLEPVDMRKAINGLSIIVADVLEQDPGCGHVFIFLNKSHKKLKCLFWDRNGFVMYYKRLIKGKFKLPQHTDIGAMILTQAQLDNLLSGLDFVSLMPDFNLDINHYY